MNLLRARLQVFGLLACVGVLVGCPGGVLAPELSVSTRTLSFGSASNSEDFTIGNTGNGTLTWNIEEVQWTEDTDGIGGWVTVDFPWLSADQTSGNTTTSTNRVSLLADRSLLTIGTVSDAGLRILSNGGTEVIRVTITEPATLVISPQTLALPVGSTNGRLTISNQGNVTQNWRIDYLTDPNNTDTVEALPQWLTVSPIQGELAPGGQITVDLAWTVASGGQDFALLVTANDDLTVVRVTFGEPTIEVTPSPVVFYQLGDTALLTIENTSTLPVGWMIEFRNLENSQLPVPISANPQFGTTQPGLTTTVVLTVTAATMDDLLFGEGKYEILVQTESLTVNVPIRIEEIHLPEILISDPPDPLSFDPPPVPITQLDFGQDSYQEIFYVGDLGKAGSTLYFQISHEDEESATPIIDSVTPLRGSTDCDDHTFYLADRAVGTGGVSETGPWICAIPIAVTIDRNNIKNQVEFRKITITAMDSLYQQPLEGLSPVVLNVRVERPPLSFEGAQHRSRPPFMLRFVFSLRDAFNRAIDTRNADVFAVLQDAFTVYEDGKPLPDETNHFVTYAEDLRYDVVMLLDYTGSMNEAARLEPAFADSADPLRELYSGEIGSATDVGYVGSFLQDLPDSYQVALMEYHDR
jgi:hypothetical protein